MKFWFLLAVIFLFFEKPISAQKYKFDPINQAFTKQDTGYIKKLLIEADKNSKIGEADYHLKSDIDTILSAVLKEYRNILSKKVLDKELNNSKYIILQPYVLSIELEDFNVDTVIKNIKLNFDIKDYSILSSKDLFSFTNFYPIIKQSTVQVDYNSEYEYFSPIRLLQSHIYQINAFLRGAVIGNDGPAGTYKDRLSFLGNILNKKNTNYKIGKETEQNIDYEFNIEKIIFNKTGIKAIVQCIYPSGSCELYFEKNNDKWTLTRKWDLLSIN
jgi:hypothetical protein